MPFPDTRHFPADLDVLQISGSQVKYGRRMLAPLASYLYLAMETGMLKLKIVLHYIENCCVTLKID